MGRRLNRHDAHGHSAHNHGHLHREFLHDAHYRLAHASGHRFRQRTLVEPVRRDGERTWRPSLAGVFTYNPPPGAVLPVGNNQPLSVSFTPSDAADYTSAAGNTTITVNPAAPSGPANLVVTRTLTRNGANVVVQLTIANTGGTAAANVVLSSVKVGADTATPLPQNIGTIAPGASAQTTVTVPASVGASGAASSLTVAGTYTGGTFNSSARITLP